MHAQQLVKRLAKRLARVCETQIFSFFQCPISPHLVIGGHPGGGGHRGSYGLAWCSTVIARALRALSGPRISHNARISNCFQKPDNKSASCNGATVQRLATTYASSPAWFFVLRRPSTPVCQCPLTPLRPSELVGCVSRPRYSVVAFIYIYIYFFILFFRAGERDRFSCFCFRYPSVAFFSFSFFSFFSLLFLLFFPFPPCAKKKRKKKEKEKNINFFAQV
jgi:hypothetical protein